MSDYSSYKADYDRDRSVLVKLLTAQVNHSMGLETSVPQCAC